MDLWVRIKGIQFPYMLLITKVFKCLMRTKDWIFNNETNFIVYQSKF